MKLPRLPYETGAVLEANFHRTLAGFLRGCALHAGLDLGA